MKKFYFARFRFQLHRNSPLHGLLCYGGLSDDETAAVELAREKAFNRLVSDYGIDGFIFHEHRCEVFDNPRSADLNGSRSSGLFSNLSKADQIEFLRDRSAVDAEKPEPPKPNPPPPRVRKLGDKRQEKEPKPKLNSTEAQIQQRLRQQRAEKLVNC